MSDELVLKKGDRKPEAEIQLLQDAPKPFEIIAVDTSTDTFTVQQDRTRFFPSSRTFEVVGSTGNDDTYTVDTSSYDSNNDETDITATGDVTDSTVDGEIRFNGRIPVNISGGSVKFYVADTGTDEMIIDGEDCTILNGTEGRIRYTWRSIDTDKTGVFPGEFVATFSDGDLTFPNSGSIPTIINEDVQGGVNE